MKNLLLALGLLVVAFLGYKFLSGKTTEGESVENFSAELISGEKFSLDQLRGKYVLVDFWGSWCPPCLAENPKLVKLYEGHKGKKYTDAKSFEMVSVAIEKNDRRVYDVIKKGGLNWPYHIVQISKIVLASPLAQKYAISDLPTKLFIGPDGNLIGRNMSVTEIDNYLLERVKS